VSLFAFMLMHVPQHTTYHKGILSPAKIDPAFAIRKLSFAPAGKRAAIGGKIAAIKVDASTTRML
jgi:hypothetical protein